MGFGTLDLQNGLFSHLFCSVLPGWLLSQSFGLTRLQARLSRLRRCLGLRSCHSRCRVKALPSCAPQTAWWDSASCPVVWNSMLTELQTLSRRQLWGSGGKASACTSHCLSSLQQCSGRGRRASWRRLFCSTWMSWWRFHLRSLLSSCKSCPGTHFAHLLSWIWCSTWGGTRCHSHRTLRVLVAPWTASC